MGGDFKDSSGLGQVENGEEKMGKREALEPGGMCERQGSWSMSLLITNQSH